MQRAAIAFAFVFFASACTRNVADPYSGTVQVPSAAVGSTTGGRIARVLVAEGDAVRAGQVLVRFDDAQQRGGLTSATARLAESRAALADLQAGARREDLAHASALAAQQRAQYDIARSGQPYQASVSSSQLRQARAELSDARATLRDARADAGRMRNLYSTGDVSAQARDAAVAREGRALAQISAARAAADSAQAQFANASGVTLPKTTAAALAAYRAAQAQYDALAAGPRPNQIRQLESNERASQGALVQARHQFDETIVRAPASGVVSAMDLHPGDLVGAGSSVATIEESGNPYVRIYVPQPELKDFAVGTKVAVHSDALPGVTFDGVVENVDARAQFTPQNVQTEDGRAGLTFGVKIRIADKDHRLQDGTTAGVSLL